MKLYKLDREDVHVRTVERETCPECSRDAVIQVSLDMRNTGQSNVVYVGCETHAHMFATRLRDSLPKGKRR